MTTTWLDRAITWASPVRGLRRARARKMAELLSYEGARTGRRTENWLTTGASADAELQSSLASLRDRARDLVRNNPYATRALDVKVANTIGAGIVGEIKNRRLEPLWDEFRESCDADGNLDLYGLQALIERVRSESGEALVRFVPAGAGSRFPIQLRVLEPDFIDTNRHGEGDNGNLIRYGIETDRLQRIVAYWLFPEHPGNSAPSMEWGRRGFESRRVPADDVIHVYRRLRAGQTRGVTDFAPVMLRMRDLDDYDDAEVMRKKIEACLAAFVTQPAGPEASSIGAVSTDDDGRIDTLYPGMVEYMKPGESISFADPSTSGGYADFQRFGLRAIAAGYGVPYELMTGDLSQVNYSSYRAGLIDFRRRIEQDQWQVYIPQVCARIWRRFLLEVGGISRTAMGARTVPQWTPPRFELIDPLKETQAQLEAVRAGFDSWYEVVRQRGWTGEEQLEEIQRWQRELTERGIVLTSDPRSDQGQAATSEPDDAEQAAA